MWTGRPTGCAHGADGLPTLDTLAVGDADRVEVEVERVESEAVVEGHEAAREEVVAEQRDAPAVDRDHRRPLRRREVDAGVRRARLAVDDPAGAESSAGLLA